MASLDPSIGSESSDQVSGGGDVRQKAPSSMTTTTTRERHIEPTKLALSNFVRMCTMQLGASMCYAIELMTIMPTFACFDFHVKFVPYFWTIAAVVNFFSTTLVRHLFRKALAVNWMQRVFIITICLLQFIGVLLIIASKDLITVIVHPVTWSDFVSVPSAAYRCALSMVVVGMILLEFGYHNISAIYMELMLNKFKIVYETTAVQCLNLFKGLGWIIGFFLGPLLLSPATCTFQYKPLIVVFIFHALSCATTVISIKPRHKTVADERTPLEPSGSADDVIDETTPDESITANQTIAESYRRYFEIISSMIGSMPMFVFIQVLSWWSLMNFQYFFTLIESHTTNARHIYLIELLKSRKSFRYLCAYTTSALGLTVYAFMFCCYCAGLKKLRKYASTANLYCASLLLFALGMAMLATIPSCVEVILVPLFPGILHATLSCITSLGHHVSEPGDPNRVRVSYEDRAISEFAFSSAQFIWAVSIGGLIDGFDLLPGVLWSSAIVSSLAAIIASRLCTPSRIRTPS
ncbi:Uncharacterised protein g6698 [Pycnogonum litorale]